MTPAYSAHNTPWAYRLADQVANIGQWMIGDEDKGIDPPPPSTETSHQPDDGLIQKVVFVNRVTKVSHGKRRLTYSALVVVGDGAGRVGFGVGQADDASEAVRKGGVIARSSMIEVPMHDGTITHVTASQFKAARVTMQPAPEGTGLIAGGAVRAVMQAAGIKDVRTKSLGSNNPVNVVHATINGLKLLGSQRPVA